MARLPGRMAGSGDFSPLRSRMGPCRPVRCRVGHLVGPEQRIVSNPNKDKGDRAEAAVRDYVKARFPESWRTRAGWDDDRGDVVLDLLGDKTETHCIQVKDDAGGPGSPWFAKLAAQIVNGGHRGGVIWWKLRGKSDPGSWRVVMTGEQYLGLLTYVRNLETTVRVLDGLG